MPLEVNSTYTIPATQDNDAIDYIAFDYTPGAGHPAYFQFPKKWEEEGLMGCTLRMQEQSKHRLDYANQHTALRIISTMSQAQEDTARMARKFHTPRASSTLTLINDDRLAYQPFYGAPDEMAYVHGNEAYRFRTVIFEKIKYNKEDNTWDVKCVSILEKGQNSPQQILNAITALKAQRGATTAVEKTAILNGPDYKRNANDHGNGNSKRICIRQSKE